MRHLLALALMFAGLLGSGTLRADEGDDFAAVRRADQRRIVATIAADATGLASVLSDDLVYAHGDGRVQTKAQLLAAATAKRVKYLSVVPQDIAFQTVTPGAAVAMSGRARLAAEADGKRLEFTLRFLALWRREAGEWKLLSYQSSTLTASP